MSLARALPLVWVLFASEAMAQASAPPGDGVGVGPFQRTHVTGSSDVCIFWGSRVYTYQPSAEGYSKLDIGAVNGGIDAAFQTWQTLSDWCSGFVFKKGASLSHPEAGYRGDGGVNNNVVLFREASCADVVPPGDPCLLNDSAFACANQYNCWSHQPEAIALTTTTYNVRSGLILDADIELNAAPSMGAPANEFTTVDFPICPEGTQAPNCVARDLQETLTHEIGHVIGLDHVASMESTMYPDANPGETIKRIIDEGTASGLCQIYPRAGASTSACTPGPTEPVTANNGGTPSCSAAGEGDLALGAAALLALWRRRAGRG